jgi:hypothetical protein
VTAAAVALPPARVWLLPCLLAPPMLLAAELTGRPAVLVPPALALAFGVWVARRPEMLVSRWRIAVLPSAGAAIGLAATGVPGPRWLVLVGTLSAVVVLLQLTRTRIGPTVAAALLPVVFDLRGPEYLISVVVLCVLVAATARRPDRPAPLRAWPWPRVAVFWAAGAGWIALAEGVLGLSPIVVAPPLFVACLDFVLLDGRAARGVRRSALLTVAGLVGGVAVARLPVPWLAGGLAVVAVVVLAAALAEPLGPAPTITLVPFVAGVEDPLPAAAAIGLGALALHLAAWALLACPRRAGAALRRPGPVVGP